MKVVKLPWHWPSFSQFFQSLLIFIQCKCPPAAFCVGFFGFKINAPWWKIQVYSGRAAWLPLPTYTRFSFTHRYSIKENLLKFSLFHMIGELRDSPSVKAAYVMTLDDAWTKMALSFWILVQNAIENIVRGSTMILRIFWACYVTFMQSLKIKCDNRSALNIYLLILFCIFYPGWRQVMP